MRALGDYATSAVIDFTFTTYDPATKAPAALASGALAVYKGNSVTQDTDGITLTASFDSVTGLNQVHITLASDLTFYSAGSDFSIVLTAGTVAGVSVAGATVATFSIFNRVTLSDQQDSRVTTAADESTSASASAGTAGVNTQTILTRIPAALVSGRMDSSVGAMAANVITATQAPNLDAAVSSRLAATFASGITSFANWLRALARKGNIDATTTTEINATTGSGTGTYDPTTDALEAVRDRGDAAWVTGSSSSITVRGDTINVTDSPNA